MTLSELKQAELLADRLRPVREAIGDIERQPEIFRFHTELATGGSFDEGRRPLRRPEIDRVCLLAMLRQQEAVIVSSLAQLSVDAAQEDAHG